MTWAQQKLSDTVDVNAVETRKTNFLHLNFLSNGTYVGGLHLAKMQSYPFYGGCHIDGFLFH